MNARKFKLYCGRLETLNLDHAKALGMDDRKLPNIKNMRQLTIVDSQELSRRYKSKFQADRSIFPGENILTISELEKKLKYRHVPLNEFESPSDEEEIRQKGLLLESEGKISSLALKMGQKFHTQILSSYIPEVSIQWVHPSVGYGLFAEEIIKKDQYVGEYTGVVRRNDRRYFEPLNNYCYEYPVPDEIGRSFVIDATAGCLTRFINHSSKPNLKPLHVYWEGFYHLIFLALEQIRPGAQLSFDYGEIYWYIREKPIPF